MSKPFSLQPLLELMQSRTDEATRQLGRLIAAEHSAKKQLQMLEDYRAEYAGRLQDSSSSGLTRQALANYQDFLRRIDDAIKQQQLTVQHSEFSTKAGQNHWKSQNARLKALDTLADRHEAREKHRENQQAQKLQDELTSRKFARLISGQED